MKFGHSLKHFRKIKTWWFCVLRMALRLTFSSFDRLVFLERKKKLFKEWQNQTCLNSLAGFPDSCNRKIFTRLLTMENQFSWPIDQLLRVAYFTFPKNCAKGLNWNIDEPSQFIFSSIISIFTLWDRDCNIIRNSVICKKLLCVFSSRVQHVAAYLKT